MISMRIGALTIYLEIIGSNSLKDKRRVLKGLKERIRQRFNVSIAEIDNQDKWQRSTLGIAAVSNNKRFIDSMLNNVINYIEKEKSVLILDTEMELL